MRSIVLLNLRRGFFYLPVEIVHGITIILVKLRKIILARNFDLLFVHVRILFVQELVTAIAVEMLVAFHRIWPSIYSFRCKQSCF